MIMSTAPRERIQPEPTFPEWRASPSHCGQALALVHVSAIRLTRSKYRALALALDASAVAELAEAPVLRY